jgi:hypothetical protein
VHAHALVAAVASATGQPSRRPAVEVADIFRAHGQAYRQNHALSPHLVRVMRNIEACRTEILGGHLDVCSKCDFSRPAYNSCRNRHCPKCQSLSQAKWIARRKQRTLPTHYFHVVFTLPEQLKPIAKQNPVWFYNTMFAQASATLLELGHDPKRLGGLLGVTAVLHTWTRKLAYHPHLHCIVTGGALSDDGERWLSARRRFLFPVKVLGKLWRGKMLAAIAAARKNGLLSWSGQCAELGDDDDAFSLFSANLYKKSWVVYAKTPFGGVEQVFSYLGRYTHRVGLSNHRLISQNEHAVVFSTKDGGTCTLPPQEFIRRFLLHVLPKAFVKIRHFGLLAPGNLASKFTAALRLLVPVGSSRIAPPTKTDWRDLLAEIAGVDLLLCPACGSVLIRRPLPKISTGPPACAA